MAGVTRYQDLAIWNDAMDLCQEIYRVTDGFPPRERFTLVSQLRRACISVPSNIAEGFVRKHAKEFRNFISIALGSLAEVETQLILSDRLGYMNSSDSTNLLGRVQILGRKTTTFYRGIRVK